MESTLSMLRRLAECRSPIVFYEEDVPSGETPLEVAQQFAEALDAHMEAVTCTYPDDSVMAGRHIDAAIQNGDWAIIMFGNAFNIPEFLRVVARKMVTLMPDVQEKPNLELFRLWLVLPRTVNIPMLFKQIAIFIDPFPSPFKPDDNSSARNERDGEVQPQQQQPLAEIRRESSTVDVIEPSPANSSMRQNCSVGSNSSSTGGELMTKVGPLFHRRLELTSGQQPQSTMSNVHELHARRVQSAAVIRRSGAVSETARNATPPQASHQEISQRPPVSAGEPNGTTKDAFEHECIATIQTIHSNILSTYYQNKDAGTRMLKELQLLTEKRSGLGTGRDSSGGDFPRADGSGLEIGDVVQRADSGELLIRKGVWRALPVLIEQMKSTTFDERYLDLTQLRFRLRHPHINTPMSLIREEESEFCYLISQLPSIGPVPVFLRDANFASMAANPTERVGQYAAHLGICVAKALSYLHASGYLHRDIAARNVVDMGGNTFVLNLTDKCLPMHAGGSHSCSSDGVAPRFSSPEALTSATYDTKDDVWGLGVMLWEVLSLCRHAPFHTVTHKEDVVALVSRGHRLAKPELCADSLWDRVVAPCFGCRKFRPAIDHILSSLNAFIDEGNE